MKQKKFILFFIILILGFFSFQPNKEIVISTNIQPLSSANSSKTILLVAAHGEGKDCNHAFTTINGKKYYENIESRIMIELIANYFDEHDIKYEIANEIVGDAYWSQDSKEREAARNCTNPNNKCCGFRTATIGSYANVLAAHVDSMGGKDYYSMVFELHFNSGGGSYTLMLGRDKNLESNGLKIANSLGNTLGIQDVRYEVDEIFLGKSLGTFSIYYEQRNIPTYYFETVFMDNSVQFQSYLNNKQKLAQQIAKSLIEISPYSMGDGGNQFVNTGEIGGLTYDPYSDYYMRLTEIEDSLYSCTNLFMKNGTELNELGLFIKDAYFLIKLAAVSIFIILSTIDLFYYLANDEKRKKTVSNILKRFVIAIVIFFLPDIVDLIFHLFGLYDLSNCGIV